MKITREYLQQKFAENYVRRMSEAADLAAAADFDALHRAFHSLAGIGGTYGHPEITRLARRGEAFCDDEQIEGALAVIDELKQLRVA